MYHNRFHYLRFKQFLEWHRFFISQWSAVQFSWYFQFVSLCFIASAPDWVANCKRMKLKLYLPTENWRQKTLAFIGHVVNGIKSIFRYQELWQNQTLHRVSQIPATNIRHCSNNWRRDRVWDKLQGPPWTFEADNKFLILAVQAWKSPFQLPIFPCADWPFESLFLHCSLFFLVMVQGFLNLP